jgi:hypothetical protein
VSEEQKFDVLVIGAMKAATSTVCAYFEDNPDIYMVPRGEPNYFSHDANFRKGPEWYATHLEGYAGERLRGEGSNDYAARDLYPESAARIAAYNPQMKIIYMVRHPLERIVSAWIQNRANSGDQVPPTLDRAVREMPDRFVGQSRYWHNIRPYQEHFPSDQIFVGFMEDLNRDPEAFFARLSEFVGIPCTYTPDRGHLNKSAGKLVPTPAYTALNKLAVTRTAKRFLPGNLRRLVKQKLLSAKVSEKPRFSEPVREMLLETLRPDAEAFLAHYGKPHDFWALT